MPKRSDNNGDEDYRTAEPAVGYMRPPKHSRYRPGQSGNPRGREKGSKNLATDLDEEAKSTVAVQINGRLRKVRKQRAMIMQLMQKALRGDINAIRLCLELLQKHPKEKLEAAPEELATEQELEIVEAFEARRRKLN